MASKTAAELRLYFLLQLAAHLLKKVADARLQESAGLSTAQAAVLAIVSSRQPISQRAVARELRQNESAMTAMVARLLKLGYVARVRSKADERTWDLRMTQLGTTALEAARPAFSTINNALENALENTERRNLAVGLKKIIAVIDSFDSGARRRDVKRTMS